MNESLETSDLSVVVSFSISILIAILFYFRDKKLSETARAVKYFLIASRFFVLFTILFLLFNPLLKNAKELQVKPKVIVLVDDSESMSLGDSSVSQVVSEFNENLVATLKDRADVELYGMNTDSNFVNFSSKETDLLSSILSISNSEFNSNVSSLIVLSDGIVTKGGSEFFNPLKVPTYCVGFGDSIPKKDAIIRKVYHNDICFTGNSFPLEINLLFKQLKGEKQRLQLKYEQRLVLDTIIIPNSLLNAVNFSKLIKAEKQGLQKIEIYLSANENESVLQNNTVTRFINVIEGRQSIALVYEAPHPDVKAFKSSFENDLNFTIREFKPNDKIPDLTLFGSVVFFGDIPTVNHLKWQEKIQKKGIGSMWITGVNGEFNYEYLNLKKSGNSIEDAFVGLEPGFSLFKLDDKLKDFLSNVPPISVPFGRWKVKNISQVLANQKIGGIQTNYPLIVFSEENQLKRAYILGEGIWRWKLKEAYAENEFNTFFRKIIQYLTVKEDKSSLRLKYNKIESDLEDFVIDAEFYNKSFELDNGSELKLKLNNEKNESYQFSFLKTGNKYRLNVGILPAGEYSFNATLANEEAEIKKAGKFFIESKNIESIDLEAKYSELRKLSKSTNGKFYLKKELDLLLKDISDGGNFKTLTYREFLREQLLRSKWLFFMVIIFLTIEWVVRKWEGLI